MRTIRARYLLVTATLVVGLAVAVDPHRPVPTTYATGPCDAVATAPNPPIDDPEPDIGGTVVADGSGAVEGATVDLYWCDGGDAVYVTSDATDASGGYLFADLTPGRWYYVDVPLAGPLAGMSPAAGTENPTDPIGLGESATDVDLVFE